MSQIAFQYELTPEDITKKKQEARRHTIWGWMEEGELAAKLHLIPLSCTIHGTVFPMGGISSVATWPEYRRQGMIKHLLRHALHYMKKNGQTVSFLAPFSFAFYRKYGWELTFAKKRYTIPMAHFKRDWHEKGYVRRSHVYTPALNAIYNTYAKNYTGMLIRDERWWNERVLKDRDHIAIAYNDEGKPEGYILFYVKEKVFTAKEIAYTSINGRNTLLSFIANHDSMAETVEMTVPENDNLPILLDNPRFEQKINPYFMARIVDVRRFFQQYPFQNIAKPIQLHIEDSFLPENSGTYQLHPSPEGEQVTFIPKKHSANESGSIFLTVQMLAMICLGYKRPVELFAAGLIRGERSHVERLEASVPQQEPYFADFF